MGAEIVVTNPSPIRWGGTEDKSDEQLITLEQAVEKDSPNTMSSLEAHTLTAAARQQFAPFL